MRYINQTKNHCGKFIFKHFLIHLKNENKIIKIKISIKNFKINITVCVSRGNKNKLYFLNITCQTIFTITYDFSKKNNNS